MFDFWYTLGSAIINPALIDAINSVPGVFKPIAQRRIIDPNDNVTTFDKTNAKTAGLLDKTQTPLARTAIRGFFVNNLIPAPPVSIYTTGRMAQLITLPKVNLKQVITDPATGINGAYKDAVKSYAGIFSPAFPAVLGLALVDGTLLQLLPMPAKPALIAFMQEFGLNPDPNSGERQVLLNATSDARFQTAATNLLNGSATNDTPWQDVCGDQFFFWDPQNERAVL